MQDHIIPCSLRHTVECKRSLQISLYQVAEVDLVINVGNNAASISIKGQELLDTLVAMGFKPTPAG